MEWPARAALHQTHWLAANELALPLLLELELELGDTAWTRIYGLPELQASLESVYVKHPEHKSAKHSRIGVCERDKRHFLDSHSGVLMWSCDRAEQHLRAPSLCWLCATQHAAFI